MIDQKPIDPAISVYPLPMSASRARHEAKKARRNGANLPKGHPYRLLPIWVPYKLAQALGRLI